MIKKIFAGLALSAVVAASALTAACFNTSKGSGHEFTVLTVKEETVKDYNTMPVFEDLKRVTGKDVYYIYNTSMQYSNNTDPVGIKGIDAIYHSGFSNLKLYDYGRRNRIVAIDEYLNHMPNFKKILESRPDIEEALKSPDGHIYSLPRIEEMGLKAYPNILFINKKWIKKLIDTNKLPVGLDLTEEMLVDGLDLTRNEFKSILQKFNTEDMDGNGDKKNEIPLTFVSGNWQGNESDLIASFGVPENAEHKTVVNGEITFTIEDEKWYDAVAELRSWHKEGLIRSASFTQDQDTFLAMGQSGNYGAFYWWEKETVVSSKLHDDYIIVKPLVDDETGERCVGMSNELEVEKSECVILGSCKDKAGLLSYFDKFFEPDYSAQLNYGSIESGAFKSKKENGKLIPNDDHGRQSADDFRMKNAPYGVVYLTAEVWEESVEMESRAKTRLQRLEDFVKPYTYKNVSTIPNLNYTKEELDTLNKYETTLGNNITKWLITAITGKSNTSKSKWQSFLNTNRASIDAVKRTNQAAYDRYIAATVK